MLRIKHMWFAYSLVFRFRLPKFALMHSCLFRRSTSSMSVLKRLASVTFSLFLTTSGWNDRPEWPWKLSCRPWSRCKCEWNLSFVNYNLVKCTACKNKTVVNEWKNPNPFGTWSAMSAILLCMVFFLLEISSSDVVHERSERYRYICKSLIGCVLT